jgi:hypothetical protein
LTPRMSIPPSLSNPASGNAGTGGGPGSGLGSSSAGRGKERELSIERKAKAFAKRKREIGPGVDRGGARLVTEKRRMGFVDDEEGEMEVDEDDDLG